MLLRSHAPSGAAPLARCRRSTATLSRCSVDGCTDCSIISTEDVVAMCPLSEHAPNADTLHLTSHHHACGRQKSLTRTQARALPRGGAEEGGGAQHLQVRRQGARGQELQVSAGISVHWQAEFGNGCWAVRLWRAVRRGGCRARGRRCCATQDSCPSVRSRRLTAAALPPCSMSRCSRQWHTAGTRRAVVNNYFRSHGAALTRTRARTSSFD